MMGVNRLPYTPCLFIEGWSLDLYSVTAFQGYMSVLASCSEKERKIERERERERESNLRHCIT